MADASFWAGATVTAAAAAGTGAVAVPALAAFGIDGYSVGAGLLGCVVVQVFSPTESATLMRIAATAIGSVLVASFGAPYIAPVFVVGDVTPLHANAVASALLGGTAKPVVMKVRAWFVEWFGSRLPPVPGKPEGQDDA